MKSYPQYKDSGIDWLGQIPEHWELKRLRYVIDTNPKQSELKAEDQTQVSFVPMESVGEYGGLKLETDKSLGDVRSGYTYFAEGDVVVAKITPCFENGKAAVAEGLTNKIAFGTTELHVLRPKKNMDKKYLFYFSISHNFRNIGESEMYGAGGQKRVSDGFIKNFLTSIPPLPEQQAIARFLDEKTEQIDALIAKKERLLQLLDEKRTALITRAVTKGLNPNAPMKDSGIPWLGVIPAHWEVKKLGYLGSFQNGVSNSGSYFGSGHPFISYGNVYNHLELPSEILGLANSSQQDQVRYSVKEGDVFFTRTSETVEEIGFSATAMKTVDKATFSGFLIRFRQYEQELHKFYTKYYFRNQLLRAFFNKEMNLVTRASLSQDLLKNMPVLVPPISEQKFIGNELNQQEEKNQKLQTQAKMAISRLKEYRSSLITHAVTGKIDVREHVHQTAVL